MGTEKKKIGIGRYVLSAFLSLLLGPFGLPLFVYYLIKACKAE